MEPFTAIAPKHVPPLCSFRRNEKGAFVVMYFTCGPLGELTITGFTCGSLCAPSHVQESWFTWYTFITRGARTGHLYAWKTREPCVGRLVCLYDTCCTCWSFVELAGHVLDIQSQSALVVTCCTCRSLGELTVKGCKCGSLGELLVTCETLREIVVTWCTCGSLGILL